MMKKLLSIVLCGTLLLSCVPAMAADITTTSVEPSLTDVENLYTVDLSGSTPVLKLNGQAITDSAPDDAENNPPALTTRGNVSIVTDNLSPKKGEKVAKLENTADRLAALTEEFGVTSTPERYRVVDSALMVDMGAGEQAAPLTGNVVIKFKLYDPFKVSGGSTVDGITAGGYSRLHSPLILNDMRLANYNHDPYFLMTRRDGTSSTVDMYVTGDDVTAYGGIVGNSATCTDTISNAITWWQLWNEYTVLYDTTNNNFKLWVNGVQYKKADGSEWFVDAWHDLDGSINDVIFANWNWLKAGDASMYGFMYFKDMSFGTLKSTSAPATWTPVNVNTIDFDGVAQDRTAAATGNIKVYSDCAPSLSGAETQVDPTTYWNVKYPADPGLGANAVIVEAAVPPVANPNANYANNKAWHLKSDCTDGSGYAYWGRDLELTRVVEGSTVNITDLNKVTVVEFDFLNATEAADTDVSPFMFTDGTTSYHTSRFLTFNGTGIYANFTHTGNTTTLIKTEDTRNQWYNIKIVFDPATRMFKTYINGEAILNPANASPRFTIPVQLSATKLQLGQGLSLKDGKTRDTYFDNLKFYEYDNNVVVHGSDVNYDEANNDAVFTVTLENNTDDAATVVPVLALYAGNILKAVKIGEPLTAAADASQTATVTANLDDATGENFNAKALIWSGSFADMKPYDYNSLFGPSLDGITFRGWNITPVTPAE